MSEEKAKEQKVEYNKNMHLSYIYKNRALELKLRTMELLSKQVELLAEESEECSNEQRLNEIRHIMAALGQAIIPD